jgi:AcrR family transcriptional regulator
MSPRPPAKATSPELPPADGWRTQRRQAAGNHTKILRAARGLLADADASALDMRDVAEAAGVGVGTVYRRFGDKAGLLAELLGDDERRLQDAILAADPPLGHEAPARERLEAFLQALVDLTERNLNILLATDATPSGRLAIGAYGAWHLHLVHLLATLAPDAEADDLAWRADLLLAALDPALYAHQRRPRGLGADRIARNLGETALRLSPAARDARGASRGSRPDR